MKLCIITNRERVEKTLKNLAGENLIIFYNDDTISLFLLTKHDKTLDRTIQLLKEKGFNFSLDGDLWWNELHANVLCDSETRLLCQLMSNDYFFEIEL